MLFYISSVDIDDFTQKVNADVRSILLRDLVEPCLFTPNTEKANDSVTSSIPNVIFFDLSNDEKVMMRHLGMIKGSELFKFLWKQQSKKSGKHGQGVPLNLKQIYEWIWQPAYLIWKNIGKSIIDGSITLHTVDRILKIDIFRHNNQLLAKEFMLISEGKQMDWIDERLDQLKHYQTLHHYQLTAQIVVDVGESLNLTGDFHLLKALQKAVSKANVQVMHVKII